jgi:large subunit ribosomal protein L2
VTQYNRDTGVKRLYRDVNFKRQESSQYGSGKLMSIEYDPNRSGYIGIVQYGRGKREYVLVPQQLKVGDMVISSAEQLPVSYGNVTMLRHIPIGVSIYNVELSANRGATIARAAGTAAKIVLKRDNLAHVKLPSGIIYKLDDRCYATMGSVSNPDHNKENLGKAGNSFYRGRRPIVRGVAKNPHDHPHGGGEGKTSGGGHPVSRTGLPERKTRNPKKPSSRFIERGRT